MQVFFGDGLGGFSLAKELNGDGNPTRLVLRDFNNDGRLDIAVNAPAEGSLLLYPGKAKGDFVTPPTELEDLHHESGLTAADLNRDGNPDLAIVTRIADQPGTSRLLILLGNGRGGFTTKAELAVSDRPTSVAAGDLNRDGIVDLVVAGAEPGNNEGNFVSTFLGDGSGNFALKQTKALGPGNLKGEIALGDFNEDGILDVAFPQTGLGTAQQIHSQNLFLFFGEGAGKLTTGPTLTVGREPQSVVTADFNKDRHLDLAVSNRTDGTISTFLGNGKGGFALRATVPVVSPIP